MLRQKRKVVVSVHGIESQGVWQKDLSPLISERGWIFYPLHYGVFRAYRFLQPWQRSAMITWFREKYREVRNRYGDVVPSIIAHSFGTYIVSEALDIYDGIRVDKVILCGSIVRRDFDWAKIFRRKQATLVRNDFAREDFPARISTFFAWDTGPSGMEGFVTKHERLIDTAFERYKHGSVFGYDHYETHWIPFLEEDRPYESEVEPPTYYEEPVSPLDAAKWSAMTYFHQYIRRVADAAARNEIFSVADGDPGQEPLLVKGLTVVVPDTPGGATWNAAAAFYKKLSLEDVMVGKQQGRTTKYGKDSWLYDIPTTINTLSFLDKRTDEELVDAVLEFRRMLTRLVQSPTSDVRDLVRVIRIKDI